MAKKRKSGRRSHRHSQKVRVDLRRNRQTRVRQQNLTQQILSNPESAEDADIRERLTGKGDLTRRRTILAASDADTDAPVRDIDLTGCLTGRVLSFAGLTCIVQSDADRRLFECTIRGVLRTLARDSRNAVVTGDRVVFRPEGDTDQGVIERVEPRHGTLSRCSHGKEHVLVANVDQILIVASASQPELKTNLIDRYLVSTEVNGLSAVICLNKCDLVDMNTLHDVAHLYSRIGYRVLITSAVTQEGIPQLRQILTGHETAVSGQSGVGKSSLLNAVDPNLHLETADVSAWSQKGRHTTRRARLLPLAAGGWVADTPGIRQFEVWDVTPEEVDGFFVEFRAFIPFCRYPDCSHVHEDHCGVRDAVADGRIARRRYDSYVRLRTDPQRPVRKNVRDTDG